MGLLGNLFKKSSQQAARCCAQCGKKIEGGGVRKYGKDFCGPKCLSKYDAKNKSKSKQACEFC